MKVSIVSLRHWLKSYGGLTVNDYFIDKKENKIHFYQVRHAEKIRMTLQYMNVVIENEEIKVCRNYFIKYAPIKKSA